MFTLFPNLESLSLSNNPLQLLPRLDGLKNLEGLSIAHTQVSHLYPCDLKNLTSLKKFLWTGLFHSFLVPELRS